MINKITEELVNERLEKIGFGEKQAIDGAANESVLNHYNLVIHSGYLSESDFSIYEENTADGYSVWVATHDPKNISLSEDVYYYDGDLAKVLTDNIKSSNGCEEYPHKVYVDDTEAYFIEEAMDALFIYLAERFEEQIIEELKAEGYEL